VIGPVEEFVNATGSPFTRKTVGLVTIASESCTVYFISCSIISYTSSTGTVESSALIFVMNGVNSLPDSDFTESSTTVYSPSKKSVADELVIVIVFPSLLNSPTKFAPPCYCFSICSSSYSYS
jgi:hypothetical protein